MSTTPNANPTGPFVVVKDGKREGTNYVNEAEAQAAAQQLKSLTESGSAAQGKPAPQVEVKRQING